jgi:hypothetical protein
LGVLVALVVFLVLTLSALLLVPYVQTLVAQRLSRYASAELGVDVRIGRFTADPFGAITLKQVYVGDLRQDTLFMVDMLKVTRPRFNSATRFLWISALEVDRVRFALSRTEGDTLQQPDQPAEQDRPGHHVLRSVRRVADPVFAIRSARHPFQFP